MDFILSCCSMADLAREHYQGRGISVLNSHYMLNGASYRDDGSVPMADFYQAMRDGATTGTSQIPTGEYLEYFTNFLSQGKDVLHVTVSSGLSGTYQSAMSAAEQLRQEFPDRKLYIVDSLGASSGYGLIMDRLADLRDEGKSMEEIRDWAQANVLEMHYWFYSTDLTFFVRGGRISKTAGLLGNLLNICPLMTVDQQGRLVPHSKIRTKRKAALEALLKMEEHAQGGTDYSGKCYISQSDCYEDAKFLADLIQERFPNLNGEPEIYDIGTSIGSHTGPGTVSLYFWGDQREN